MPQTHGRENSAFLIKDLLDAVQAEHIKTLHFTHFHYLHSFPENELRCILEYLQSINEHKLTTIIFDIDSKYEQPFKTLHKDISENQSALPPSPGYGLQGKALADYLKQLSNQDDEKTPAP